MDISGRHVVVTGGSRGIGEAIARECALRGAKVTIVARNADALRRVATDIGGNFLVADLSDDAVVDSLIHDIESQFGPIDVLVNNAGLDTSTPFAVEDVSEVRAVSRLNLEVPMLLSRHVLPGMLTRGRGHLVYVSSLAGTAAFPGMAVYCGTKAGIFNFSETVRRELKATPVNITVLSPGPVDTQMWDNVVASVPTVQKVVRRFQVLRLIPTANPEQIARRTVSAIIKNSAHVRDPKRLSINFWLNIAPTKISNLVISGIRFNPLDTGKN